MAADRHSTLFASSNMTASPASSTLITNEDEVIMLPQAAPAAFDPAAPTISSFMESNLHRVQNMAGADNSIDGSVREIGRELNPSLIPCSTNDIDHTSTVHDSRPPIHHVRCSLKGTLVHGRAALQLQLPGVDNELELVPLQDDDGEHCMSSVTRAHEMQCSISEKLPASKQGSTENVEIDEKEEDGEVDQEEGCVTPTARDQRIPQYNFELNTSGLVCPPAPKKKPNCASKRRRLFYSASDAGADVNYDIVAERRAFLVDPPDLHNFPDCVRALFK